jgi:aminoglycoside phosphotransferase
MDAVRYREFKAWSIVHGMRVARISVFDQAGREFCMIISAEDGVDAQGLRYRARRENALDCIEEAMRAGLQPGEIRVLDAAE